MAERFEVILLIGKGGFIASLFLKRILSIESSNQDADKRHL